jgi:hypothetical protein
MKKFLIKINAYQYHAEFEIFAEDNVESIENSIVDKLGEKGVKWEYLGEMMDPKVKRITYEEVSDAITSERSVQTEESTGSRMGAGAS